MPRKTTRIAIIGLGLIGGSLGLALRRNRTYRVVGWNRKRGAARRALKRGAIRSVSSTLRETVADADIIVLGVPVPTMEKILVAIAPALKRGAIVTDVGSVKGAVETIARRALRRRRDVAFVGGHPLAGSEQSGIDAAHKDLFRDAVCVLTSGAPAARRRVATVWRAAGARCVSLSAGGHDRFLALTSHLPHAIAFSLVLLAARDIGRASALRHFLAPSFRELTRIAASNADLWTGIFSLNRRAVAGHARQFVSELNKLLRSSPSEIRRRVAAAARARQSW